MLLTQVLLTSFLPLGHIDTAHATDWFDSTWSNRMKITIDYTRVVSSTQSNFPVLVSSTSANFIDVAQEDGDDFVFTASDGSTQLDHEIESYTSSTGALVAWVRVPSLSNVADTEIYIYYGKPGASNQENPAGVWDSNFAVINHMSDDPTAGAPQMLDSTSHNYDGTVVGDGVSTASGKIGAAVEYAGSSDYIDIAQSSDLVTSTNSFTISGWMKVRSYTMAGTTNLFGWASSEMSNIQFYLTESQMGLWAGSGVLLNSHSVDTYAWDHYVWTRNGNSWRTYVNGVQVGDDVTDATSFGTPSGNYHVNAIGDLGGQWFDGWSDEFRVSNTARSTGWIATEYNNQNSPSSFYSFGSEESAPAATPEFSTYVFGAALVVCMWYVTTKMKPQMQLGS